MKLDAAESVLLKVTLPARGRTWVLFHGSLIVEIDAASVLPIQKIWIRVRGGSCDWLSSNL